MSLKGSGLGMLGIDHQHETGKAHGPGGNPGVYGRKPGIRFEGGNRKEIYESVWQTASEQQYHVQGDVGKGLLRSYIAKTTSLSRAQVTRLIGQYLATGKVEEKGYCRRSFPSRYTRQDIELL